MLLLDFWSTGRFNIFSLHPRWSIDTWAKWYGDCSSPIEIRANKYFHQFSITSKDIVGEMGSKLLRQSTIGNILGMALVTPHGVTELGHDWFRQRLVSYSASSSWLNQCSIIVDWTLTNKLQWNLDWKCLQFNKSHFKMSPVKCRQLCSGATFTNMV